MLAMSVAPHGRSALKVLPRNTFMQCPRPGLSPMPTWRELIADVTGTSEQGSPGPLVRQARAVRQSGGDNGAAVNASPHLVSSERRAWKANDGQVLSNGRANWPEPWAIWPEHRAIWPERPAIRPERWAIWPERRAIWPARGSKRLGGRANKPVRRTGSSECLGTE